MFFLWPGLCSGLWSLCSVFSTLFSALGSGLFCSVLCCPVLCVEVVLFDSLACLL